MSTPAATPTPALKAGAWLDGYQAQAQAPEYFTQGSRSRHNDGHYVRGAWSDPWWLYCPDRGWAIAKRWKSKAQTGLDWVAGEHRARRVEIPAVDEVAVEPWTGVAAGARAA